MSRYLVFFALVALAVAYPASDSFPQPITTITETDFEDASPWFKFPTFGNIFGPLQKLFTSFANSGPRIIVDDDKFQVIMNVKEYQKDDLKVKVKGDFILVHGAREAKHDDHDLFASQFFHTYTLPLNSSASDVTATLSSDGYLDVVAPINGADEKNKLIDREVPIIESGKPLNDEKDKDVPVAPTSSSDNVENDDKVENSDKVENVEKVENNDKVENIEKFENSDKVEPIEKVESAPPQVTTESPVEVEVEKKEPTTASPLREEVTEGVQENKIAQDNEVNEVSNANEIQP